MRKCERTLIRKGGQGLRRGFGMTTLTNTRWFLSRYQQRERERNSEEVILK